MSDRQRSAAPEVRRQESPPPADPFRRPELLVLPMALATRLAAGRLRLGELLALTPGALVPLDTAVGEPAQLLVGDTPIAAGELVEVKGRLEFRVTRLGGCDD